MTNEERDTLMIETNKNVALNGQKIDLFIEEVNKWRTNHDSHHFSYFKWVCISASTIICGILTIVGSLLYYILTHLPILNP